MNPPVQPFFYFYGGKSRAARHYPPPEHDLVVEPFAGAAGYALHHHQRKVHLYDIDPIICGLWDYLIHATEREVLNLPLAVECTTELPICQEARWLIGFWLNQGVASPRLRPSAWVRKGLRPNSTWGETVRTRIANQLRFIRHWRIHNKSYEDVDNHHATWFIDPPYNCKAGRHYRFHTIDYGHLATWCQKRKGQAIVCEVQGATWLPFQSFRTILSHSGIHGTGHSREVIWTNQTVA